MPYLLSISRSLIPAPPGNEGQRPEMTKMTSERLAQIAALETVAAVRTWQPNPATKRHYITIAGADRGDDRAVKVWIDDRTSVLTYELGKGTPSSTMRSGEFKAAVKALGAVIVEAGAYLQVQL